MPALRVLLLAQAAELRGVPVLPRLSRDLLSPNRAITSRSEERSLGAPVTGGGTPGADPQGQGQRPHSYLVHFAR